ncbi:hypothetical protein Bca4012_062462 [Brassica carinata]
MGRISCRLKSAERSMLTEDDGFGVDSVCESLIRYQQRNRTRERDKREERMETICFPLLSRVFRSRLRDTCLNKRASNVP